MSHSDVYLYSALYADQPTAVRSVPVSICQCKLGPHRRRFHILQLYIRVWKLKFAKATVYHSWKKMLFCDRLKSVGT